MKKQDMTPAVAEMKKRLERARELVRKYVPPDRCLSEELIRERQLAALHEQRGTQTK